MSVAVPRVARLAPPLMLAALLASGCEKVPETSMDLLRAGNPSICTAADVENTVRSLIYPDGVTHEGYTIAFADASLEAFDQVVSRATCNAALTIDGPDGTIVECTMIDFVVAPAAQDPANFIVSGAFEGFTLRMRNAIETAVTAREEAEGAKRAEEAMVALVKPGWLVGRWVSASAGSDACINGSFYDFGRNGRLVTAEATGRWSLNGLQLRSITAASTTTITIANANMNEFSTDEADADSGTYRRCSRDEMRSPPAEDPDAVADRLEALANELEDPSE